MKDELFHGERRLGSQLRDGAKICVICGDEVDLAKMEHNAQLRRLDCWREHVLCDSCTVGYLLVKVLDADVLDIPCPCKSNKVENCQNYFSQDQVIRILADNDDLEQFEESLRADFDVEQRMYELAQKYKNLDQIYKYKKFHFN